MLDFRVSVTGSNSNISSDVAAARRKAAVMVAACTVFGAAAQILINIGMGPGHFVPSLMGLRTDFRVSVTGSNSNISSDVAAARRKAAVMVAACTVFGAAAQILDRKSVV